MQGDGAASAAQSFKQITVGNRKILVGKLSFTDFSTVKEQAAEDAKRSLIQTYTKNQDLVALLPKELQATAIQDAFLRAEKITADSLPPKKVWTVKRDPNNGKPVLNTGERFFHKETNSWIETGKPIPEEQEVEYSGWWVSQTNAGRIFALWLSMRKCPGQESITLDEVTEMVQDESELEDAANTVGEMSQPTLGN